MTSPALASELSGRGKLLALADALKSASIDQLFSREPQRATHFILEAAGLHLDYSKHLLSAPARLDMVAEGRGDIAMGNLTITPERKRLVDFSSPLYPNVNELVVSGPAAPGVSSFDDLG